MKQDKAEKMIQKAERKAQKAAQQVQITAKKAEAQKQKQAAQAQKKAAKKANAATKKAAQKTKKAEAAAKKAQLAAKKAEEKKAKALAKVAAKAVETSGKAAEGEEGAAPKKKSKKKLLMIAVPVLAVAIGAGVYFFVLRGGEEEEEGPPEPIAIPAEYVLAERAITALPVWGDEVLVYREEIPPEPLTPAEDSEDAAPLSETEGEEGKEGEEPEKPAPAPAEPEEPEGFTKILYRYEGLQNPGALAAAYTAVMITEDAGFSTVDEDMMRIDPPEFEEMTNRGSVLLARNVPAIEEGPEAGTQSLLLTWDSVNCSVTLDMPEKQVHDPKPPAPASASPRRSIEDLETMHPSQLGLLGDSMDEYDLVIQEGSVRIANSPCIRVNIYDKAEHQIAGSYFISSDGKLYRLEEEINGVLQLQWE